MVKSITKLDPLVKQALSERGDLTLDIDTFQSLREIAKAVADGIKLNNGYVIAICGPNGVGKSTLAILLGMLIHLYLKIRFDFEKNIIYVPDVEYIRKTIADRSLDSQVFIVDEAIKVMHKRRFASREQVFLAELFASLHRKTHKIFILCMPRFAHFDKYYREDKLNMWIEVMQRGLAVVFLKSTNPLAQDSWCVKENQRIWEKAERRQGVLTIEKQYKILRRFKTFYTGFRFPDLASPLKETYESLVEKHSALFAVQQKKVDPKLGRRSQAYRTALVKLVNDMRTEGIRHKEIATRTGLGLNQLKYLFSQPPVSTI